MASNATVPNSFSNGAATDAPAMNANFTALLTWLNTNAVHLDAAKAFTGVPSGPATDPTTANHLTRKSYVDAAIAALVVGTASIADGAVQVAKLATDSVTTVKIVDLNVTTAKLADLAVTTGKLADVGVTAAKLATDAVETAKIKDLNVTNAKLAVGNYASIKNSFLDDLSGAIRAAGSQSIPNATATNITFAGTEVSDPSAMHSTSVNTDRVTCATAGTYRFDASVGFQANNTGGRQLSLIRYNSGGVAQEYFAYSAQDAGDSASNIGLACSGITAMAVGDYVVAQVTQDSGGALNTIYLGVLSCMSWTCVRVG